MFHRRDGAGRKYQMPNSKYQRWAVALTASCALGLVVVLLAAVALASQYRFETRGTPKGPQGFPQPIAYADVPRWGVNVALEQYGDAALQRNLDAISTTGFAWVRQTFPWAKIESECGHFDWTAWDRIVSATLATPGRLNMIAVLDTSPAWARPQSPASDVQSPPSDLSDFAHFAGEFARRYGDRIHYYQIWDEPNLGDRWNKEVNPTAYAEMLRQAREAILAADPHAVILLAGLAPTVENSRANMSDWLYLQKLYEVGAGKYFDIVSGKPYGFSTGPDDRRVDPMVLNFSHIILMREEMESHGDADKPLWASNWGWNALPPGWSGKPSVWGQVTQDQQASYTLAAMQRVEREWPWIGVMALENWQPATHPTDPHWGFAIADQDGQIRPLAAAIRESRCDVSTECITTQGVGYHPSAQSVLPGSKDYVPNVAEFSPPEDWRFSELGADWAQTGDKVTLSFRGTGLALRVRRAADRANFYITIDGRPANALPRDERGAFLQLIPPDVNQVSVDTIPVATGLPEGVHTAEIVAERGWNQWSLVGWSVQSQAPTASRFHLSLAVLALLGAVFTVGGALGARRVQWNASAVYRRWGDAVHVVLLVATTIVFYASTWLTWSQQIPSAFRRLDDGTSIAAMLGLTAAFYFSPWLVVTILSGLALFLLILLRLDLGLALVALVIPFYMLPRAIWDRVFSLAEIVVLMCLVAWLLRLVARARASGARLRAVGDAAQTNKSFSVSVNRLSTMDWAALAFVAVAIASLFIADYPKYALREFRGIVLEPALFYLMFRTTARDNRTLWRIVDALMLAGLIVAIVGLVQFALNVDIITAEEGQHRLRSVYGSPNNVGLFLGRVLPVMLAVSVLGQGRRRWLYGLSAVPVALAIVLSFSKGALLLGVPAALLVMGLLVGGRWLWATLGALAAGGLAAIPILRTPRFQSLLDLTSGTSFFRINVWQSALLMIRDHPILGVGLDNFLYQYRGRYMFPEAWAEPNLSHPHDIALDYAARMGLLGLAAGIWLQVAFWREALPLRKLHDPLNRALAIGLMGAMADFLAHGLVDASYFVADLSYVFFITLAVVQVMRMVSMPSESIAGK
jgi:O-antigen ligase